MADDQPTEQVPEVVEEQPPAAETEAEPVVETATEAAPAPADPSVEETPADPPAEEAPAAAEEPAAEPAAQEPAPDQTAVQSMLQAAVAEAQAKARAAAAQAAALAAQLVAQHAVAGDADGGNKRGRDEDAYADDPSAKRHAEERGVSFLPNGEAVDVVDVPADKIGRLIGRAGATIKVIQERGMTRLKVDHNATGSTKPVTITGTPENVALTRRLIHEAIEDSAGGGGGGGGGGGSSLASAGAMTTTAGGDASRKFTVPPSAVGRIIGRGGETIRSVQSASGAHINVNQNFPEGEPREIEITGRSEAVDAAYRMVMDLVNADSSGGRSSGSSAVPSSMTSSREVTCPKNMVGRIIGRGGETIKNLQKQYSVSIQIDQASTPCRVTITGPSNTLGSAERAVLDLVEDRNGPGGYSGGRPGPGGPGGYPAAPGGYGGAPAYPGAPPPYAGAGGYGAPPPPHGGYGGAPPPAAGGYGAPPAPHGGYGGAPPPQAGGYGAAPQGAPGAPQQQGAPGGYGAGGYGSDPYAAAGGAGGYGGAPGGGYGGAPAAAQGAAAGYGGGHAAPSYGGAQQAQPQQYGGAQAGGYGGAQAGGYAAAPPPAAPPPARLPAPWTEQKDDQGRVYYYNTQTGASQWERPQEGY